MNTKTVFDTVVALINASIENPANTKWARVENPASMVNAVAIQAIDDATEDLGMPSKAQIPVRAALREISGCELRNLNVPFYLMKNEIAAINAVVAANI